MDTTKPCKHCGEQVYHEGDLLVEVRSGDDGGTYDYCQSGPDNKHEV